MTATLTSLYKCRSCLDRAIAANHDGSLPCGSRNHHLTIMTDQNSNLNRVGNPKEAEPGRGAPGNQWAVQTAQPTNVHPADEKIPSNVDESKNRQQIADYAAQEEGTLPTSHGFVIDESGRIDNFAVEPPMYVEE